MSKDPKLHCPVCNRDFLVGLPEGGTIEDYIGNTIKCPLCLGVLKINENLQCVDFIKELKEHYKKCGFNLEGTTISCISA